MSAQNGVSSQATRPRRPAGAHDACPGSDSHALPWDRKRGLCQKGRRPSRAKPDNRRGILGLVAGPFLRAQTSTGGPKTEQRRGTRTCARGGRPTVTAKVAVFVTVINSSRAAKGLWKFAAVNAFSVAQEDLETLAEPCGYQSQNSRPQAGVGLAGANAGARHGIAKRRKRSAVKGAAGGRSTS